MTQAERMEMRELSKILDTAFGEEWDRAYDRYMELSDKLDREFYDDNIDSLKQFYDEHIANRTKDEINPEDWNYYSDYHKDVFGHRPRGTMFG